MKRTFVALLVGAACLAAPPVPSANANGFHATFDGGRLRDDLRGALADTTADVIRFRAIPKSKLSLTLSPDASESATPAAGLSLVLRDELGTDLAVAGGTYDKSKGDGIVRWSKVPISATGTYQLEIAATTPGGWRLTLSGTSPAVTAVTTIQDLAPQEESEVVVEGLARAKLDVKLQAPGSSKFQGEVARIEQPDGTDLPSVPESSKVKVRLVQDGPHRVFFRNVSSRLGDAKVSAKVIPSLRTRAGRVRPAGTVLVPHVKSTTPSKGYHKDDALAVIVTGFDFQPGLDVRLVRNGRPDIVGTSLEFVSEGEVSCRFDLDTGDTTESNSVGKWKVGVWNAPEYTDPADPATLVRDSPTSEQTKPFESLSNGSIRRPDGIEEGTEVWHVRFLDDFQTDLNRMGLGSEDVTVRKAAREAVEAYTILFLRDLFRTNETNGKVTASGVPLSFVVEAPSATVGLPGEDYARIDVGGTRDPADPADPDETLSWGHTPLDAGNVVRDDLTLYEDDGVTRRGLGVRTRVLDPTEPTAAASWVAATLPLRNRPLTDADLRYYTPEFVPLSQFQADRYRDVVEQTTRAAREIAAIVAHHVGKAMGIDDGGLGPMANPASAGDLWPTTSALYFADSDVFAMRDAAVPHELPGKGERLVVGYFPLRSTQTFRLPDCTTDATYTASFALVGGRPNASLADYRNGYLVGSEVPRGLTLTVAGLSGKAPTMYVTNVVYCDDVRMRIAFEDRKTGRITSFRWGLKVLPDMALVPPALRPAAQACRDQLLSAP